MDIVFKLKMYSSDVTFFFFSCCNHRFWRLNNILHKCFLWNFFHRISSTELLSSRMSYPYALRLFLLLPVRIPTELSFSFSSTNCQLSTNTPNNKINIHNITALPFRIVNRNGTILYSLLYTYIAGRREKSCRTEGKILLLMLLHIAHQSSLSCSKINVANHWQ